MPSNDYPRSEDSAADGKEYRLPKYFLVLGIACMVLFALIGTFSTVTAAVNVDGSFRYPVPTAIFLGCFCSGWTFLGVFLILASCRVRLFVSPQTVRTTGIFRTREVQLPQVGRAIWKSILYKPSGELVFHDPASKVLIHYGNFRKEDQVELIQFFREKLTEHVQEGWDRFALYCVPDIPSLHRRRERARRLSNVLMPVWGAMLIAMSIWDPCGNGVRRWPYGAIGVAAIAWGGIGLYSRWRAAKAAADDKVA